MRQRTILPILLIVFLSTSAQAFDGKRKGLIVGGGLGAAPLVAWDTDPAITGNQPHGHIGLGGHFILGFAWNEHNLIAFEGLSAFANPGRDKVVPYHECYGLSYYHYFGSPAASPFLSLGLGGSEAELERPGDYGRRTDPGWGILFGAGYEFDKHGQAGLYIAYGQADLDGLDVRSLSILTMITVVAY